MMDWILRNARIADDQPLQDIAIHDGKIALVDSSLSQTAKQEWDLAGHVLLPGMIDIHTHLDKTYASIENQSGTLQEAIELWSVLKTERTEAELSSAMQRAIRQAILHGVTAMRSHINADRADDAMAVEIALALREEVRDLIDLQLVALGRPGLPDRHGHLEESLRKGLDYVGGAPSLQPDPKAGVDAAFALAEATGKPIDLHIDETEDPNMLVLEYLAEQTIVHGMQGQVTAGHCCSLSFVAQSRAEAVMDKVAEAQITIVTLPSCNLVLMGRQMNPTPRGTTRVKELLARGVNVCAASDNVHDPFNPFGSYDLLQIANLNAHVAHMTGRQELLTSLAMVNHHPARAWGHQTYGLVPDAPADLVVIEAERLIEAVLSPPARLATFKKGKMIVRTQIERTWL